MKIKYADAVTMMLGLAFDTANTWPENRLVGKLKTLNQPNVIKDDATTGDQVLDDLLDKVVASARKGEKIELTDVPADKKGDGKKVAPAKPAPAPKVVAKKAAVGPAGKVSAKPTPGPGRGSPKGAVKVGVISTIVECLEGASKTSPVTKQGILDVLVKKFKDRSPEAMKSTVTSQVPSGLRKEKPNSIGPRLVTDDKGGWWLSKAPAAPKAAPAPAAAKPSVKPAAKPVAAKK